jgi:Transposase IS116/IS110/IS902 family
LRASAPRMRSSSGATCSSGSAHKPSTLYARTSPSSARASLSALVAQMPGRDWGNRQAPSRATSQERGQQTARDHSQHRRARRERHCRHGPDAPIFKKGRDFAAWIGIVSREESTGGKQRLGPISKQGDRYLQRLLIVGAFAVLRQARAQPEKYPWVTQLLARKLAKVVAVAIANKTAARPYMAQGGPPSTMQHSRQPYGG